MDKYAERLQQIKERTLSAKSSLWSALLTAHTVLLSVAVVLLVTQHPPLPWGFKLSGFLAILCMALLLLNFALTKAQYQIIGQRLANPEAELPDSVRDREVGQANFRWRLSEVCEFVAALGLAVQVVIFGWVLATI